jgi:hypothetical protein
MYLPFSFPLLYLNLPLPALLFVPSFSLSEPFLLLFLYPYLPLLFLCKLLPFSASVYFFPRSPVPSFPHSSICTFLSPHLCLPFSASVYGPLFLSCFVPSFLRFFIYSFLSMLDIFFLAEDQGNIFLLYTDTYVPNYTTSYAGKQ